jgi:hypothetical protein
MPVGLDSNITYTPWENRLAWYIAISALIVLFSVQCFVLNRVERNDPLVDVQIKFNSGWEVYYSNVTYDMTWDKIYIYKYRQETTYGLDSVKVLTISGYFEDIEWISGR